MTFLKEVGIEDLVVRFGSFELLVFFVGFFVILIDDLAEAEAGKERDEDALVVGGGHDGDLPGIRVDGDTSFERLDKGVEFTEFKVEAELGVSSRHEFHFVPSFEERGPSVNIIGGVEGGGIEFHFHDGIGVHGKEIDDLVIDGFVETYAGAEGEKVAYGHASFVYLTEEITLESITQPHIEKQVLFAVHKTPGIGGIRIVDLDLLGMAEIVEVAFKKSFIQIVDPFAIPVTCSIAG